MTSEKDEVKKLLNGLKHSWVAHKDINYIKIPVVVLKDSELEVFNSIYKYLKDNVPDKIVRTASGGISVARKNQRFEQWDIRITKSKAEITACLYGGQWRIQFGGTLQKNKDEEVVAGGKAYRYLYTKLKTQCGVDLHDYEIKDGQKVNSTISKYQIKCLDNTLINKVIPNAHHIDFKSAFASNLVEKYPEFKPVIKQLFDERKIKPRNKSILTNSIGYMHSKLFNFKLAHLAKAAIDGCNEKLNDIVRRLRESGRYPILLNTDGVWYTGDVYHGDGEGKDLGCWENDVVNARRFRMKSAGSYEYETEEGKYVPKLRGHTRLDDIKPREEWEWGDIYRLEACEVKKYAFVEDKGLIEFYEMEISK